MQVNVSDKELIEELIKRLKDKCYCNFNSLKPELKPLKKLITKRWNEPIDMHCIE